MDNDNSSGEDEGRILSQIAEKEPELKVKDDPALPIPPAPPRPTLKNHANSLMIGGSILIVIAMFTVVTTGWQSYSSAARMLITLLPLIALYAIALSTHQKKGLENMSRYALLTGSSILPFVLGVILHELQQPQELTPQFFLWITSLSALWYIILEYLFKEHEHAPLTITFVILSGYFLGSWQNFSLMEYTLMGILVSALFLLAAFYADQNKHSWQGDAYGSSAILLGLVSLLLLPQAMTEGTDYFGINSFTAGAYIIVGLLFFAIAACYAGLWKKYGYSHMYTVRVLCENCAPVIIVGFPLLNAFSFSGDTVRALVLILAGVVNIALSNFVKVRAFRICGQLGVGFGAFLLVVFAFTQLQAIWPILLLLGGFILIGGAYLIQKYDYKLILSQMNHLPERSLYGLGEQAEGQNEFLHLHISSPIIIVLFVLFAFFSLIGFVSFSSSYSGYGYRSKYDQGNFLDPSPATPYAYPTMVPATPYLPVITPEPLPTVTPLASVPSDGWTKDSFTLGYFSFEYLKNSLFTVTNVNMGMDRYPSAPVIPFTGTVYSLDGISYLRIAGIANQDPTGSSQFTSLTSDINPGSVNGPTTQSYGVVGGYVSRTVISKGNSYRKSTEILLPKGTVQVTVDTIGGSTTPAHDEVLSQIETKVVNSVIAR